jgi:hypothetical protein
MAKEIEINRDTGWIILWRGENPYPMNIRGISYASPDVDNKCIIVGLNGSRFPVDHPYDEVVKYLTWMI